ncbi:hypothetical protein NDU88_005320 [Pleurodeles waltl]|uniref:Uncharacterized protein n=1 Tax=Pleurodeles waltl TaxID=8319 RepID=A0AAV7QHU8_PLEWA|nr:hypothetical protein NDU88_005320 [Pleurodeles waltl]
MQGAHGAPLPRSGDGIRSEKPRSPTMGPIEVGRPRGAAAGELESSEEPRPPSSRGGAPGSDRSAQQ